MGAETLSLDAVAMRQLLEVVRMQRQKEHPLLLGLGRRAPPPHGVHR